MRSWTSPVCSSLAWSPAFVSSPSFAGSSTEAQLAPNSAATAETANTDAALRNEFMSLAPPYSSHGERRTDVNTMCSDAPRWLDLPEKNHRKTGRREGY